MVGGSHLARSSPSQAELGEADHPLRISRRVSAEPGGAALPIQLGKPRFQRRLAEQPERLDLSPPPRRRRNHGDAVEQAVGLRSDEPGSRPGRERASAGPSQRLGLHDQRRSDDAIRRRPDQESSPALSRTRSPDRNRRHRYRLAGQPGTAGQPLPPNLSSSRSADARISRPAPAPRPVRAAIARPASA